MKKGLRLYNWRKMFVASISLPALLSISQVTHAQQILETPKDKFSLNVTLNSDIFFGFYPFFNGSYELNDKLDFTFYGILWSGGTGGAWGNWTEFGGGVGINVSDALYVNPQIGLLNGSLTSGLGEATLAEGIVPNLTVLLNTSKVTGELYAGYYYGFNHGNPVTNNYLHWWLTSGYQITDFLNAGLHFEHLRFTGGQNQADGSAVDLYQTLGPYVMFSDPNGSAFARFSTGFNTSTDDSALDNFFKLTVGYGF